MFIFFTAESVIFSFVKIFRSIFSNLNSYWIIVEYCGLIFQFCFKENPQRKRKYIKPKNK